jgi:1-acyl-sn-glycerol-3-phosphate acyltransferase
MSLFTQNEYHTKENRRVLADKMMLGTSGYFLARFIHLVLRNRKIAVQGRYNNDQWVSSSHDVLNLVEECGGVFHITGLDNLRKEPGPVVMVSNHMSTLENMIFPGIIARDRRVTFVVKSSLVTHPVFGPVMRSRNPIVLSRSNPREDLQIVMSQGLELLKQGCSIMMFPQSTRTTRFIPAEFNSIGVKLAGRAKVPVLPVAIKTDFWRNGMIIKDLGSISRGKPIFMTFAEPVPVHGNGREEHAGIVAFINSELTKWEEQTKLPARYRYFNNLSEKKPETV